MVGLVRECPRCGAKDVFVDELYDARGIYCGTACDGCMKTLERTFRPEVLTDSNYDCDEQIEED